MEDWKQFFKKHELNIVKIHYDEWLQYSPFTIERLYQNFKQRFIDEAIEELKEISEKEIGRIK